jgi:hypothetical protein
MQKRNDTKIIYEIKKLTNQLLSAINVTVFFFFLFSIFDFTIVAICFCYKAHYMLKERVFSGFPQKELTKE